MHSRSPPFAAMGVCLMCVCEGRGVSNDDPQNQTCNSISLPGLPSALKDWVLEKMIPCLPLPNLRQRFRGAFPAPDFKRWLSLLPFSSFRNLQGTFGGWEWNRGDGEGSRRCHFGCPSPCACRAPRREERRARAREGNTRIPT